MLPPETAAHQQYKTHAHLKTLSPKAEAANCAFFVLNAFEFLYIWLFTKYSC